MRGSNNMKKRLFLSITIFLAALMLYCETGIVGSQNDTEIQGVVFTVDTTFISNSRLIARGLVKNATRRTTIDPPWFVEGQFYTNAAKTTKLGGDNFQINIPLSLNQETFWELSFSSSIVNVQDFPDFVISDLRAILKN